MKKTYARVKATQSRIYEIRLKYLAKVDIEGMTSERRSNKNPYFSFLHKNNDLTTILVPKYLEKKFSIQLRSRSSKEVQIEQSHLNR